jgi:hypothetical protein
MIDTSLMNYLKWNELIAKYFFNDTKAGREVLIYVNDELIDSLGESNGVGVVDFIESIKLGPNWATRSGLCQKALQTFEGWRTKKFEYPPYLGYLAFFVLASGTETDFAPHSYYPGFWKRLGEPQDNGTPPSFDRMIELWRDLEKWTREEKCEMIGRFIVRLRGGYSHVGLPWSQTLLSEHERKFLPNLFSLANLDPTDPPPPETLFNILRKHGPDIFERRTIKIFNDIQSNIELRDALIQFILDQLEEWDGSVQYQLEENNGLVGSRVQAGLRICLNLDSVARVVKSYLRFKTTRMFPEGGLHFRYKIDECKWSCEEAFCGWSKPLRKSDTIPLERLDASLFDWSNGIRLEDIENGWYAYLRSEKTRLFRINLNGLPDWVETQRLERNIEFLVACYLEDIDKVKGWGANHCEKFEEKNFSGLPSGWKLFYGKNATESCPGIDALTISSTVRLVLDGGIKASGNNRYFKFSPPSIVLENSSGTEKVRLNGEILDHQNNNVPTWELPDGLPAESAIQIEIDTGEQLLKKIIWLVDFDMPLSFNTPCKTREGKICNDPLSSDYICGAVVNSNDKWPSYTYLLPTYLSKRIVFIGERPGEISDWPHDNLPTEWHPVWAIADKGKKQWKVHFCGNDEQANIDHCPGSPINNIKDIKRWKEAVWIRRKITTPPEFPRLKNIWNKYLDVAQNV